LIFFLFCFVVFDVFFILRFLVCKKRVKEKEKEKKSNNQKYIETKKKFFFKSLNKSILFASFFRKKWRAVLRRIVILAESR
jgi:hypothetical protein